MIRSSFALGAASVFTLALASCASDDENAGPCPNAFALHEASRIVEFVDPASEEYSNVAYTAEFQAVRRFCRYVGDDPINLDLEMEIGFGIGPAATERRHTYNMWVAVTRTDVAVLEKVNVPVTVTFPRGEDRVYRLEEINNIIIPRAEESTSGSNFEVLVGFEVDEAQLEFNRLGKRFTIDAVQ